MTDSALTFAEQYAALETAVSMILGEPTLIVPFNKSDHVSIPFGVAERIHQLATSLGGPSRYIIDHRFIEASDDWGKERSLCGNCDSLRHAHMVQK